VSLEQAIRVTEETKPGTVPARDWLQRAYAHLMRAQASQPAAYEMAKQAAEKCIAVDASYAACHFIRAESALWMGDDQTALHAYTATLRADPRAAYAYAPLAEAYLTVGLFSPAEQVIELGTIHIAPGSGADERLVELYVLEARAAQMRGLRGARRNALRRAHELGGNTRPRLSFELAKAYLELDEPPREEVVRLLGDFLKHACPMPQERRLREDCREAELWERILEE
jgi:tetratricopeptide (TPR) repeat protein